ncbi:MAG: DUF3501 family protein [Myxococcota bacterium]
MTALYRPSVDAGPEHLAGVLPLRSPRWAITQRDILDSETYRRIRSRYRPLLVELKCHRRVRIAPNVVILFENRETVLFQIHEVLRIEGHHPARVAQELRNYECLLPRPGEWRATVMIDGGTREQGRRLAAAIRQPGAMGLSSGPLGCNSELARDDDEDADDAVQYLRFRPPAAMNRAVSRGGASLRLSLRIGLTHLSTAVSESMRDQLARDLDPPAGSSLLQALAACPFAPEPGRAWAHGRRQ